MKRIGLIILLFSSQSYASWNNPCQINLNDLYYINGNYEAASLEDAEKTDSYDQQVVFLSPTTLMNKAFELLYDEFGDTNSWISDEDLTTAARHLLDAAYLELHTTDKTSFNFLSFFNRYVELEDNETIYSIYEKGCFMYDEDLMYYAIDLFKQAWINSEFVNTKSYIFYQTNPHLYQYFNLGR